jgi:hypothetical protein
MTVTDDPTTPYPTEDDLEDESWLATTTPKGLRVRLPLAALALGIALAGGIWGGAVLQAHQQTGITAAGGPGPAGAGAGLTGAGAAGGANGGANGRAGTTGTITSVKPGQIQITTVNGSTVIVTMQTTTTITKSSTAAPSDLTAGESVTVRGTTASDGTTTAQSIAVTPAPGS